ncbi:MAG TPA: hypothetical protein VK208_17500 [Pyrinomonadaceae bacterium]|nr:hypothetical protein [Pyrinomonadaceae bacterium]
MRSMNCKYMRREIEAAGSSDLLSAAVIAHIRNCAGCEMISRQHDRLQAIVSSLDTVAAPGDFEFRLRARLAGEKSGAARTSNWTFSFGLRIAAVAVTVLLIVSAALLTFRSPGDNPVVADGNRPASKQSEEVRLNGAGAVSAVKGNEANLAAAPKDDGSSAIEANSNSLSAPSRKRQPRTELAALRGAPRFGTRDLSSTSAPVVKRYDQLAETYPTAAFPINASYQSLKVSVDDGHGVSRTISLPSVSFGSQRSLSQTASPLMASARGTW